MEGEGFGQGNQDASEKERVDGEGEREGLNCSSENPALKSDSELAWSLFGDGPVPSNVHAPLDSDSVRQSGEHANQSSDGEKVGTEVAVPASSDAKDGLDVGKGDARMVNMGEYREGGDKADVVELTPLKENHVLNATLMAEKTERANEEGSNQPYPWHLHADDGDESGTEEEQAAFMRELENFFKERSLEFKPPKFYGEGLNCLKLWRAVTKLGGYDTVTSCKLWRQVGESFKPPKTCTTVSWSFRIFYEKALLDYERHKVNGGEICVPLASLTEPISGNQGSGLQSSGSGRARRDAAARAMQGWHTQRLLGNGEVGDPIIKDKNSVALAKREKQLKNLGLLKRKKPSTFDRSVKPMRPKLTKPHDGQVNYPAARLDTMIVDVGPTADWVKINVRRTKDCFEIYALVPGLLREEVRVQSDPAGRLVISGEPEQPDNPWGVTPFKKVITLPSRIDPHQTSAVVTLHGQLFVRAPFEQSDL